MASMFRGLTFDAYDAHATAAFWAAALGREVAPGATPDHAELLGDPATGEPRIAFDRVRDGGVVRNALHLDLVTADLDREAERLVRLGARRVGRVGGTARWVALTDPEGNAFELVAA